ncbi:hypothetical protein [Leptospira bandrabouensis]|uniref:Uncharacterized protein n=1 Tax=Leptospira bandrabouensis TaxID=2484903 RepID=A0A6H3NSU9_9LEPT|nr:hypothetical protein [Leptospira bandrabouensis]TGN09969.1 hypothetical protein EHR07_00385 [Leptospira bandrabouensis]TGN12373.1 hypothetical protein EHR08_13405 [Leptospira bandrabouensis]
MDTKTKQTLDESHLESLNAIILREIIKYNRNNKTNFNEVHVLNAVTKYNRPPKNKTKATAFNEFYSKDLSELEIKILDLLEEESMTRKEISKALNVELCTISGIIANVFLANEWVEVSKERACRISGNKVEELHITRIGKQALYDSAYIEQGKKLCLG